MCPETRRSPGRMVNPAGSMTIGIRFCCLENRWACKRPVGSNPTPAASFAWPRRLRLDSPPTLDPLKTAEDRCSAIRTGAQLARRRPTSDPQLVERASASAVVATSSQKSWVGPIARALLCDVEPPLTATAFRDLSTTHAQRFELDETTACGLKPHTTRVRPISSSLR